MRILLSVLLSTPLFAPAQSEVSFERINNWKSIYNKARDEYKYIFIHIDNAQSCTECATIDRDTYTDKNLGKFLSENYISVRVSKDSLALFKTPAGYNNSWLTEYKIRKFPSYIILSPDGILVHKSSGQKNADELLNLARTATDPSRQYYTLLNQYEKGKKDYPMMHYLAITAKEMGDTSKANAIAADYKQNYLDKLNDEDLCRVANIDFISKFLFLMNTKDRFFKLFYDRGQMVDAETYKGCADIFVVWFIIQEEVVSKLWQNNKPVTHMPDWERIADNIKQKFGRDYAERIIPGEKLGFYQRLGNWAEYARIRDEQLKLNPPKRGRAISDDPWIINRQAWDVFLESDDTTALRSALRWVDMAISLEPDNVQFYDTKANLLYKLGYKSEAIEWERSAIQLGIVNAQKRGLDKGEFYDEYSEILAKMQKNEPTWRVAVSDEKKE